MTLNKLILKIARKLDPPSEPVDKDVIIARLMDEMDLIRERLLADPDYRPPTPEEIEAFERDFAALMRELGAP
jgi:hypothetical protein